MITLPVLTADSVAVAEPPAESLRPWVAELERIPLATTAEPFVHLPQTSTTIVLRADPTGARAALVIGPQTKAAYAPAGKAAECLRLRLTPGAVPTLLGLPAARFTDRVVRLADVPGPAAALAPALIELAPARALRYLAGELPRRLAEDRAARAHRHLLDAAVAAISKAHGVPVPELAATLAVSERQLRNLFTSGIGVSPKHFARIDRLRRILSHAGTLPWADLATANGYYDQSHLSADFRNLMGVPPGKFFRGQLPAPSPCRSLTRLR